MNSSGNLIAFALLLLILPLSADLDLPSNSTVELGSIYSPGDTVIINTNFMPENAFILSPANEKFELEFSGSNGSYSAEFPLTEKVVLGEYRVFVDGIERSFIVDHCSLNLEYAEGTLKISANTFYVQPEIEYTLDSQHGKAVKEVTLQLSPGEHELSALCLNSKIEEKINVDFRIVYNGSVFAELDGKFVNATLKVIADREYEFHGIFSPGELEITSFYVEAEYKHLRTSRDFDFRINLREVYFPGEIIEIKGNFTSGKLIDPTGNEEEIIFENGTAFVDLRKNVILGKYRIILDGFEREFFVDSYSVNATFWHSEIVGNVSYFFVEPEEVICIINDIEKSARVENGSFRIRLELSEGNYTAILKAGNAEFLLSFEVKPLISAERLYFLGEKVRVWIGFEPERILLEKPSGSFELNLSDGFVEFLADEIGEYRIVADGAEFNFFVDSYEIQAEFRENLTGKVLWHFVEPDFIEIFDRVWKKIPLVNGSFEFSPEGDFVILKCGNAKITAAKEPNYQFVGRLIEIFSIEKPAVMLNESAVELNVSESDGIFHSTFFAEKAGMYDVLLGEKRARIIVDECRIEANVSDEIEGRVSCLFREPEYIDVFRENGTERIPVSNGSFRIEAKGVVKLSYGNAELLIQKDLRNLYFVGERLELKVSKAKLFTPSGILEFSDEIDYVFEEAGVYRLELDGIARVFYVENYSIEAFINGSLVEGRVSWNFFRPSSISFKTKLGEGNAGLSENGEFSIALDDGWEFVELKCGNAFLRLIEKSVEVERLYFVGDKVVIRANFKPEESFILFGEEKIQIEFSEKNGSWFYEFVAEKIGSYRLVIDGVEREFFVDSCSIEARVEEKKIQGKAMANFTEIDVGFVIFPLNSSGSASLGNGTFEIDLPEGAEEVLLFCGNSEVRLKLRPSISDFRSFEFEGKIFNLTLSKGRFEELGFDGENASLVISGIEAGEEVELSIEMPFEIPEGLHVYYWKEINGSIIPVNYSISEDRRKIVFRLQDGVLMKMARQME